MKTFKDVKADDKENSSLISLEKLTGKRITDLYGTLSKEFGDEPIFQIYRVCFSDGTSEFAEGEHDIAYLPNLPGVSDEELENIYKTDPDYTPSEDEEEADNE